MNTLRVVTLSILASGCATTAVVSAPVEECTNTTPLVPGIPGSPGHLLASTRNPNGDSELAALMRRMVSDWEEVRAQLGGAVKVLPRFGSHRRIRCSWPTAPADREGAFDSLAINYLSAVQAFDAAPSRQTYDGVLNGCQACHEVTCGGPIEVIDGLRIR